MLSINITIMNKGGVNMQDKCFADTGSCKALKTKKCDGCNFYKSYVQSEISRKRAVRRLKSLDEPARLAITEKYNVGGIM